MSDGVGLLIVSNRRRRVSVMAKFCLKRKVSHEHGSPESMMVLLYNFEKESTILWKTGGQDLQLVSFLISSDSISLGLENFVITVELANSNLHNSDSWIFQIVRMIPWNSYAKSYKNIVCNSDFFWWI